MGSRKPRRPEVLPQGSQPRAAGGQLSGRAGRKQAAPARTAPAGTISATRSLDPGDGVSGSAVPGSVLSNSGTSGTSGSGADTVTATVLAFPEPPGRRRRRWFISAGITAVVLLAAFLAFLFLSPALALKTITVQGNSLLPTEQVQKALHPLMGEPLTTVSQGDVAGLLADRPEIAAVDIVAHPPSEIVVTITERVPVAVLQSGNSFLLIDEQGRELAAVASRAEAKLPLIDGGTEAVNSRVFSTVTSVLAVLPEKVLAQLDHAAAASVDSVELKLTNGQTVFWGSAEANVAKARAVEALLAMPAKDPPVSVFDVSTPTAPVTR